MRTTPEAMNLHVLASGSRGNAAILRLSDSPRCVMIDAGLSPRRTRHALEAMGLSCHDLTDIVLTHADSDHLHAGWARAAPAWSLTMHAHQQHLDRVLRAGIAREYLSPFDQTFAIGAEIEMAPVMAPHDVHGTVAFAIHADEATLGWATDLGRFDAAVRSHFRRASPDVMAIESNYDEGMQVRSDRPAFLIDRIMGGYGHLSNGEALEAVLELDGASTLTDVVLLHRSTQCNCPQLIESLWQTRAPHLARRVTIASQDVPCDPINVTASQCPT